MKKKSKEEIKEEVEEKVKTKSKRKVQEKVATIEKTEVAPNKPVEQGKASDILDEITNKRNAIATMQDNAKILLVPIVDDGIIVTENEDSTILIARSDTFIQQLVADEAMKEDETFEERVDSVFEATKAVLAGQGFADIDKNFFFYKDHSSSLFNFKIYIQDLVYSDLSNPGIVDAKNQQAIRNVIAFFLEPKRNQFFQLTLNTMPFQLPTQHLKIGKVDLENDPITSIILDTLYDILNSIIYKK